VKDALASFVRETGPGVTVVTVTGELDATNTGALRASLEAAMEDAVDRRLVVDLSGVTFLDSSTVNVIVWARKRSRELNTALQVVAPAGSRAAIVFELAGLASIVPMASSTEGAIEALTGATDATIDDVR
jgi:anti-anti-sigma factor